MLSRTQHRAALLASSLAACAVPACGSDGGGAAELLPVAETDPAIPAITFELDTEFSCRVASCDPAVLEDLAERYGVEIVSTMEELAQPGDQVKFLPLPEDPNDGYMQAPKAVWDEAAQLLPRLQDLWSNAHGDARGQELMRRIVRSTGVGFPFESKTIRLFVCPDPGAAYGMQGYPIYNYLETVYQDASARWTERDFVDWYMLHEILHWYLLYQPWLRVWTPSLEQRHAELMADDPAMLDPPLIFPADGDYPDLWVNQVDSLGHLHLNAIRYAVLATEPETWAFATQREKQVTGDKYYAWAIDVVESMGEAGRQALLDEVTDNPAPCAGQAPKSGSIPCAAP